MTLLIATRENLEEKEAIKCKGLFYRCRVNKYATWTSVGSKITFRLLKKRSCPGCDRCDSLLDDLRERLSPHFSDSGVFPDDPKDGEVYRLTVTSVSRDWESGVVDDWDLGLVLEDK